ncbi:MAG: polyphosphate kinase 2 family protein [Chloracidobacterium sp.]|nr:polyphosphate kinase 2 family protein [Chloracidobacterium sp.]MCO5334173.1 polyphosphate kinase 2 family protein [Pyrinomonadaceae bacterium]
MKTDQFLVPENTKLDLKDYKTDFTAGYHDKSEAVEALEDNVAKLSKLQDALYAEGKQALLVVLQAMDAAGKDSTIEHVMSGVNPQGCQVVSFKQPSAEDLAHDFLWRCQKALPERGKIGIFNRSHYEEVLVVRVHPSILAGQALPADVISDKDIWKKRYESIRRWEEHLGENGVRIIKFFLHVSKDEQKKRFLKRIDQPEKNWKFSMGDVRERALWDEYMKCYTEAIAATSTKDAPWYIIPADTKWFTRLAVSEIIVKTLEKLDPQYPKMSDEQRAGLAEAKKALENE